MLRILIALPLALGIALGLFTLMAYMVDTAGATKKEKTNQFSFNMVMVEKESAPERKQRHTPPPQELPPPPPEMKPINQVQVQAVSSPRLSVPHIDLALSGISIQAPQLDHSDLLTDPLSTNHQLAASQQAMPLYRAEPRYPTRAIRQGLEGYVDLSFTINSQGRPIDISVIDAEPKRIFNKAAIDALRKWKYQPKVVNGTVVHQTGQTARLEFKLNQ